jgi:hypothetical protein
MKIADVAPDEAQLIDLSELLSELLSTSAVSEPAVADLDLDSSYLEAARTILASLSEHGATPSAGELPRTRQQIETHLDFDPAFLDVARSILRDFIDRKEIPETDD